MAESEVFALFVSAILSALFWLPWLYRVSAPPAVLCPTAGRWPLLLGPLVGLALIVYVLRVHAAEDVRDAPQYLLMYALIGLAWLGVGRLFFPLLGLYARADVIERRNSAAGMGFVGALVGLALCYAGGNIGNGPGWWVVLFSAGLATVAWFVLWGMVDAAAGLTDMVTIGRDSAAGFRLGGLLVGMGLVLGRAVAGDWTSAADTVEDFVRVGWPVVALPLLEMAASSVLRPTAERLHPDPLFAGSLPGLVYVLGAASYVLSLGSWA